jgi:hypothetical protein
MIRGAVAAMAPATANEAAAKLGIWSPQDRILEH